MVLSRASSPFGSRSRTRILVALQRLDASYPRALARLLETPIFAVRKALAGLERDGLVASRLVGRTRVYALDPSYAAHRELAGFLQRLSELDPEANGRIAVAGEDAVSEGGFSLPERAGGRRAAAASPSEPAVREQDGWRNW
jgi:DNA-binding transcriptional ArsR family regulator